MGEQASLRKTGRGKTAAGKARTVLDRRPAFQGWRTTDEDEIERRRWRGRTEIESVEAPEPEQGPYGDFWVRSASGGEYLVEIRSLVGFENSTPPYYGLD